jgi:hypothetical protein
VGKISTIHEIANFIFKIYLPGFDGPPGIPNRHDGIPHGGGLERRLKPPLTGTQNAPGEIGAEKMKPPCRI